MSSPARPLSLTTESLGALYEKNLNTSEVTTYYFAGSQRVAMRKGGVPTWFVADHPQRSGGGSTSVTLDASGNKIGEMKYYPFGETRYRGTATSPTDRQFTGQRADSYINLYEMGARWYSPVLGRWLSPDTIVPDPTNPQGLNRLSYVYNNPLKHVDSTGHCADDDEACKAYEQWILDYSGIELKDTLLRNWTADEARLIYETLYDIAKKFYEVIPYKEATELMKTAFKGVSLTRAPFNLLGGGAITYGNDPLFPDFNPGNGLWDPNNEAWTKNVIAHELGHAWDFNEEYNKLSRGLAYKLDSDAKCFITCVYDPRRSGEEPVGRWADRGSTEDWAMAFAQYVEPYNGNNYRPLGALREQYVRTQIALLVAQ